MIRSFSFLTWFTAVLAGAATASVHELSCSTTKKLYDGKVHSLKFQLENLEEGKISLVDDEDSETGLSFSTTPKSSKLSGLTENWGITRRGGNVRWTGDSDGFFDVELVLYADSAYRAGYVKINDGGEGIGDSYSPLRCRVKLISN